MITTYKDLYSTGQRPHFPAVDHTKHTKTLLNEVKDPALLGRTGPVGIRATTALIALSITRVLSHTKPPSLHVSRNGMITPASAWALP